MVEIITEGIYKYYGETPIIQNLSVNIKTPDAVWIAGANGRGKSTLLSLLSGLRSAEKGKIIFKKDDKVINAEQFSRIISIAAPYQGLPDWLTLSEIVEFHGAMRGWRPGYSARDVISLSQLEGHLNKSVAQLSSGLRQRLRLALAWFADSEAIFLDEPCAHLDKGGEHWYLEFYNTFGKDKLVVVCSNNTKVERAFCNVKIDLDIGGYFVYF